MGHDVGLAHDQQAHDGLHDVLVLPGRVAALGQRAVDDREQRLEQRGQQRRELRPVDLPGHGEHALEAVGRVGLDDDVAVAQVAPEQRQQP